MPCVRPVIFVLAVAGVAIVPPVGPDSLVQAYEAIVPSASVPAPANETVDVGNWMD